MIIQNQLASNLQRAMLLLYCWNKNGNQHFPFPNCLLLAPWLLYPVMKGDDKISGLPFLRAKGHDSHTRLEI